MNAPRLVSVATVLRRPAALGWASLLVLGIAAAGCTAAGTATTPTPAAGAAAPASQAVPPGVSVSCAPGQRTLVRQLVSNGQPVMDVQCVADQSPVNALAPAGYVAPATNPGTFPQAGAPSTMPAAPTAPVAYAYPPPPVETWAPQPARPRARTVAYRTDGDTLTYEPRSPRRVARSGRSWKKSAVIIGSSAGLGAGIGAAMGGKKGALIGAALGGGSAAIWDQATRR